MYNRPNLGAKRGNQMKHTFGYLAVIASLSLAACGEDNNDLAALEDALAQDFGALDATDEEPMFDEPSTYDELGEAEADPAADPEGDATEIDAGTAADDALAEVEADTLDEPLQPLVYALRVTWGRQHFDATAAGGIDWNPTLRTDCGIVAIRRLVRFDAGEHVVRPRTDAQSVSFVSTTGPHFDGVAIALIIPAAERGCTGNLYFESAALDADIVVPLDESLTNLVLREDVGGGNEVVGFGQRIEPSGNGACVRGHVVGRWRRAVDGDGNVRQDLGRFYGRTLNEFGDLRGHVRGIWGRPKRGAFKGRNVFFGKYIDAAGTFKGLIAGRYGLGLIGGGWHLRPVLSDLHGLLGGRYTAAPDIEPDGGLVRMRYASTGCLRPLNERGLGQ